MTKRKQGQATKAKLIRPDREAIETVKRDYPNASPSEKYRLAQAITLLRMARAGEA